MSKSFPFLFVKKGRVMPLIREENKVLKCRRCGQRKDEVSKYGWIFCDECEDYIRLTKTVKDYDMDALANKHSKHKHPCCSSKTALEDIENCQK
jgi:late competence protein required for DNA uptake (superfamily II DNA/RNA helicase)